MESTQSQTEAPTDGKSLRTISQLPGPPKLPMLGNILQLKASRVHQDVESMARTYGRLFRLTIAKRDLLVVADHALINNILRDRPNGFRRPSVVANVSAEMGAIPGLFLAEGEDWRNQRRMVMHGMAPTTVKNYFPSLVNVALRLRRRWETAADKKTDIRLSIDLKRFTVDVIAGLAFGVDVNTIESDEDSIQRHIDVILPGVARRSMSLFPYWRYIRLPMDRQLEASLKALQESVSDLIRKARKRMEDNPSLRDRPGNLLEAMIAAADENDSGVDDRAISGNVSTLLIAGEDTTANTLAWMLYLLHRHPDMLKRAQDEVHRIAPDTAALTIEQMDALDFVEACALEAMRLKPVAPYMRLEAIHDTAIGDVHVPAGTVVWCVLRHDSVDRNVSPDASEFKPTRWLQENATAPDGNAAKKASIPFGAGPRICPGRYLALLEIKIALAMLLGNFEIEAVETPDGKDAQELTGFVMSPVGLSMRLRRLKP